jgi:hypothetical protein
VLANASKQDRLHGDRHASVGAVLDVCARRCDVSHAAYAKQVRPCTIKLCHSTVTSAIAMLAANATAADPAWRGTWTRARGCIGRRPFFRRMCARAATKRGSESSRIAESAHVSFDSCITSELLLPLPIHNWCQQRRISVDAFTAIMACVMIRQRIAFTAPDSRQPFGRSTRCCTVPCLTLSCAEMDAGSTAGLWSCSCVPPLPNKHVCTPHIRRERGGALDVQRQKAHRHLGRGCRGVGQLRGTKPRELPRNTQEWPIRG